MRSHAQRADTSRPSAMGRQMISMGRSAWCAMQLESHVVAATMSACAGGLGCEWKGWAVCAATQAPTLHVTAAYVVSCQVCPGAQL